MKIIIFVIGRVSARSYKIGVGGNKWVVTQFSQKQLQEFF